MRTRQCTPARLPPFLRDPCISSSCSSFSSPAVTSQSALLVISRLRYNKPRPPPALSWGPGSVAYLGRLGTPLPLLPLAPPKPTTHPAPTGTPPMLLLDLRPTCFGRTRPLLSANMEGMCRISVSYPSSRPPSPAGAPASSGGGGGEGDGTCFGEGGHVCDITPTASVSSTLSLAPPLSARPSSTLSTFSPSTLVPAPPLLSCPPAMPAPCPPSPSPTASLSVALTVLRTLLFCRLRRS